MPAIDSAIFCAIIILEDVVILPVPLHVQDGNVFAVALFRGSNKWKGKRCW